jgi:DNA invertase Pin-like site-specific DNA recombinase
MANVLATFAQFERRLISQRTKDALAIKQANGTLRGPIGRPRQLPDDVVALIRDARAGGMSLPAIAQVLNRQRVPTAHGGKRWYPSTVRAVVLSAEGARQVSERAPTR